MSTRQKLVVGDYVSVDQKDGTFFKGQVTNKFKENEVDRIAITNRSMNKTIDIPENDKALKPLFYFNKKDKKVNLRFDEREVASLIKKLKEVENKSGRKSEFANLSLKDFTSQKTKSQLLQGKRTNVMNGIVWEKERELESGEKSTKQMPKQGRFQLYYDKNNDYRLSVNFEQKNLKLTVPKSRYNREFTKDEIQKLNKIGNLGLVEGFLNKDTGEEFKAFVAVDKELNSVVLRNENSIKLDKIYAQKISATNQKKLAKGEGIVLKMEFGDKKTEMYVEVNPSSVSPDGLIKMEKNRAIEKGFLPEVVEKKKTTKKEIEI